MSTRKVSPRKAALLAAAVLATSTLSSPALAAVQTLSSVSVTAAAAPATVVTRLSLASGSVDGGNTLLISGTGLATGTDSLTPKAVKFGSVTVDEDDVTAVSAGALEVEVPEAEAAGPVTVLVGDAKKGPSYKYVGAAVTVTTAQEDLDELEPTTDTGLATAEIVGTGFEKATAVLVGGKPAKVTSTTATKLVVALPAGLKGIQDVVVSDPRNSVYVGYVDYVLAEPTVTAASSYAVTEAPTVVTLTGTKLDAVATVTYKTTEKVTFAKTADPTKLVVTVPKGAADEDGVLKVTTKNNKSATFELERKASPTPTVTAGSGAVAAGGDVTLTGTGLIGLKSATVTKSGKATNAKVVSVTDEETAKINLPKLAAGTYSLVVKTNASAGSTAYDLVVASSAPTVTAASVNDAKKVVTLTGTNFKGTSKVVLTPETGTAVTAVKGLVANTAGTSLVVTLPTALADGTYGVVATSSFGSSTAFDLTVGEEAPPVDTAPTLTAVSFDAADDVAGTPASLTLEGENLEVGTSVRYTLEGGEPVVVPVSAVGSDSAQAVLEADLEPGTYAVEVSADGETWSESVALVVS